MSGKSKDRKDQLTDFLRYRTGQMPDRERNEFERNLQKDPFAEEAIRGYEEIDPGLAEKDILDLKKRLNQRITRRTKVIWYRVAASIAVLMILSSIFIIIDKKKPQVQLSYSPVPEPSEEITRQPVPSEQPEIHARQPEIVADKKGVDKPSDMKDIVQTEPQKPVIEPAIKNEPVKESVREEKMDAVSIAEAKGNVRQEGLSSKSAMAKRVSDSPLMIRGKVVSAEDNQPIPGVSINIKGTRKGTITDTSGNFNLGLAQTDSRVLVASFIGMTPKEFKAVEDSSIKISLVPSVQTLSEVVVVGYGVAGADSYANSDDTDYVPPVPVIGKAGFERYIRDNLKYPDSASAGQRVVVVAGFLVRRDGTTDSIRIIRSPAGIFSKEAIRLIEEGPAWKPAVKGGMPVDDEVKVRIVFK